MQKTKIFYIQLLTVVHSLIVFVNFYSSTCVHEGRVCQGVPLCPNQSDLKWCKNASTWGQPQADWKPLYEKFLCSLRHVHTLKEICFGTRRLFGCEI